MISGLVANWLTFLTLVGVSPAWTEEDPPRPATRAIAGRLLFKVEDQRLEIPASRRLRGMFLFEPSTNEWKQVGDPDLVDAVLSSDGRSLVAGGPASGGPKRAGVWIYDLAKPGSAPRRAFDQPYFTCRRVNDGQQLIVSSPAGAAKFETFRVDADGSNKVKLPLPTTGPILDSSADGAWVAWWDLAVLREHRARIQVIRSDGTEAQPIIDEPDRIVRDCRFSPDGRRLVYGIATVGDPPKALSEVWVVDRDGRNKVRVPLELEPGTFVRPFWSPDGQRLAVALAKVGARGDDRVVLVDLDGKNLATLPPAPWRTSLFDWR